MNLGEVINQGVREIETEDSFVPYLQISNSLTL